MDDNQINLVMEELKRTNGDVVLTSIRTQLPLVEVKNLLRNIEEDKDD